MPEPYCVELRKPTSNAYGWFISALRTENGIQYYLTVDSTVEADDVDEPMKLFYFATEVLAYEAMVKYFDDWGEPFPYELPYKESIQQYESEIMKFE